MLKLRPYCDNDAKYILDWIKEENSFRMWSADRYESYPVSAEEMNRFYAACGEDGSFFGMTALDESGVCGHLTMRFQDAAKNIVRLGFIIVDDTKRGMGYGREMLSLALQYAFCILKAEKVTLGVFEENSAACDCYKLAGFEETAGAKKEVYHLSTGDFNCVEMEFSKEAFVCANGDANKQEVLPGMKRRSEFLQNLEQWKQEGVFRKDYLLMLCVELDGLSNINKIYGYSEGNAAIQTMSEIIDVSLSEEKIYAHLGGREFAIAFPVTDGEENKLANQLFTSLKERVDTYNQVSGKEYSLSIREKHLCKEVTEDFSMQDFLEEILHYTQISWGNGKKTKEIFKPEEELMMKDIMDNNRFAYAFQPIVEAKTGEIYAYEALMRTNTDKQVSPLTILQYAGLEDRLYDIEKATLYNVMSEVQKRKEEFKDRRVFINSIPGYQLNGEDYGFLMRNHRGLCEQIVIEVTEQTELDDENLEVILERSKQDGFALAIDDYGTGYSNTSSLLRYLPNCVKIDRILISNIQEEPKKQHFVKSIIEFCHENGIKVLAEGVENRGELKAVINMGVDLIQGFYTAKPSFEVLQELPPDIRDVIINASISTESNVTRKIFMADDKSDLLLVRLALEQYTGIVLAGNEATITGNVNYSAAMTIKIRDEVDCKLVLNNVHMESFDYMPCIDIGKRAHLTIVLEGDNELSGLGIRVPEDSSVLITGAGDLTIYAKGAKCYGIGNESELGIGSIACETSGKLAFSLDGDCCYGIGGGVYRRGDGIRIDGGNIEMMIAGSAAIGIGCDDGDVPIDISHGRMHADIRVFSGMVIGSLRGKQNICLTEMLVEIEGSGSKLCGIGSTEETGGSIEIDSANVKIGLNGQNVYLLGDAGGGLSLTTKNSGAHLRGEGSNVIAFGSKDKSAIIYNEKSTIDVKIQAGNFVPLGAEEENIHTAGGEYHLHINEN